MNWQPELHATYCPQHYEPGPDGGGSSWLCRCTGALAERAEPSVNNDVDAEAAGVARSTSPSASAARSASAHVSGAEKDTA